MERWATSLTRNGRRRFSFACASGLWPRALIVVAGFQPVKRGAPQYRRTQKAVVNFSFHTSLRSRSNSIRVFVLQQATSVLPLGRRTTEVASVAVHSQS